MHKGREREKTLSSVFFQCLFLITFLMLETALSSETHIHRGRVNHPWCVRFLVHFTDDILSVFIGAFFDYGHVYDYYYVCPASR